jgi:cell wall-associated NlpC family hydrolase
MLKLLAAAGLLALALVASAGDKRPILGYLGQATSATRIYAAPNSHARIFSRIKANKYLVIKEGPKPGWYAVLLTNATYGFVPTKAVKELPYQVHPHDYSTRSSCTPQETELASRSGVANYALQFIGTPYKWGGTDENSGIDCSGFVKKMYGKIGVQLPRTAAEQVKVGQPVYRLEDLISGDRLYFWDASRGMIGHTGIYLGGGRFVHSSHGHHGVATDYLTAKWRQILVAARRS